MKSDSFQNLYKKLQQEVYPLRYLYKFICKSEDESIAKISELFPKQVQLSIRESTKGNFTSISIQDTVDSADEIITKYKKASEIKGVIIL